MSYYDDETQTNVITIDVDKLRRLKGPSITLEKFKLKKDGVEVTYTETLNRDGNFFATQTVKVMPFQPLEDLLTAMKKLVPHLMLLCELVPDNLAIDTTAQLAVTSIAQPYTVTGIVVKDSGATIIGRKTLAGKKILNLTTPFYLWDDETSNYGFSHTLMHDITTLSEYCVAYIEGDYIYEQQQLGIDFDTPANPE